MEAKGAITEKIDLNTLNGNGQPLKKTGFPASVYNRLPRILSDGCNKLTDETEKAVFLISGLGVISGMLPNVYGIYDGRTVYPNLFVYILGQYGGGKGGARFARELGMKIHQDKREETKRFRKNYQNAVHEYNQKLKIWRNNKLGEPPVKPAEPVEQLHFVPANNSKSGLFELLAANEGAGTIFETEGDSLTDAIRQDYGNYSDGLRKGFHHEPISFYRRLNKEFIEIENPRISLVLSSTFDQLLTLIPTAENGLFSRFLFYELQPDPGFKNVFDKHKTNHQQFFRELGDSMAELYYSLQNDPEGFVFRFSDPQKDSFLKYFKRLKAEIQENITTDLDGTVNRLGLIFFRIAMILTVLRKLLRQDGGEVYREMYCTDQDFQLTQDIIETLKNHAISVYLKLPQPQHYNNSHIEKAEQVKKALELHQAGQSYGEISQQLFNDQKHKSTVYRWINCPA
jgi:hypothetical protein